VTHKWECGMCPARHIIEREGLRRGDDLCCDPLPSRDLWHEGNLRRTLLLRRESSARTRTKLHDIDLSLLHKTRMCAADVIVKRRFTETHVRGWAPLWNLSDLWPASPTVAPRRRGSIPMSRSYSPCEEILGSVTLTRLGWTFAPLALRRVSIVRRSSPRY
jgi:hypothetical protein